MVTIGLAFDEEDSMPAGGREAQPDVFCFHAGTTKGGLRGYDSGETIEETSTHGGGEPEAARALAGGRCSSPTAPRWRHRGRAVHPGPHHLRRLLDRVLDRATADRARDHGGRRRVRAALHTSEEEAEP